MEERKKRKDEGEGRAARRLRKLGKILEGVGSASGCWTWKVVGGNGGRRGKGSGRWPLH